MAITLQKTGPLYMPQVSFDTSSRSYLLENYKKENSFDPSNAFSNYFDRVHKKYDINTSHIENLVNRVLQDPTLINQIRDKTLLRKTFKNRLLEDKTDLGEVFQELQYSQQSPNRKLLPKKTFILAEKEAETLANDLVLKRNQKISKNKTLYLHKQEPGASKIGDEFQINTNIQPPHNQTKPSIAFLSNGNFVTVWVDGDSSENHEIFFQICTPNRTKIGSEFHGNTYTEGDQSGISVKGLKDDKFIIVWNSANRDGSGYGISYQFFNNNGTPIGSECLVNTYIEGNQLSPSVEILNDGKIIIVWTSQFGDGSGYGISGIIIHEDGTTKNGNEFLINTKADNDQIDPLITRLSNNEFVVVWISKNADGELQNISGQRLNEDGTKKGNESLIYTYTSSNRPKPWRMFSVTALNNGEFVVVWSSNKSSYAQVFREDWTKMGKTILMDFNNINTSKSCPAVAKANKNDDEFVVVWEQYEKGVAPNIYGQVYHVDGRKNGMKFLVNTHMSGEQRFPAIASLENQFVVTWASRNNSSDFDILGQIFQTVDIPNSNTVQSKSDMSQSFFDQTNSTKSDTKQTEFNTDEASGAERQTRHIALTALNGIAQTIKNTLGC